MIWGVDEIDTRRMFGSQDLRRQRDADRYCEALWRARVWLRERRHRDATYFGAAAPRLRIVR